jgi:hypothetical protein
MNNFPPESKCWIYAANRILTKSEIDVIKESGSHFVQNWTSHQKQMHAMIDVIHQLFVVIALDESQADISGCGIDKSVGWIKQIGEELKIDFFNRTQIEMQMEDKSFKIVNKAEIVELFKNNSINPNTFFTNKNINNLGSFKQSFYVKLEETWFYPQITSMAMQV